MATIFSKIINGEIPSHKIAETDDYYAFLDINPLAMGHTLVVPKREVDYIFDLDDEYLAAMTVFAKRVAKAVKEAIPCKKIGVAVIGLEVPHAHIHLVPMQQESDIHFGKEKLNPTQEELAKVAELIRQAYR
ncbi:HIT family hydrolase [Porphyromonas crevioricanis]|uniref:HIT family hydrolase n=1 Tax=Porphyromonas crevioricanis TaxID=393921 RepID=A0A0A2FRN0_9PORP|nr:HIT family protein [Porphyromonas crevioricanis]KGN89669.1 HIT family hydrolase [Porphyromonas crevioricanis]KGN93776.1 HIT family hydrolase [Porphyromonas crevioricanis]GAD08072.1 HIT family protein [Porphyromonas crevioricanis JCM 13913]SQH72398.1 purine nucleoside phosphoramidase [Porphyromonas crevioricanis]